MPVFYVIMQLMHIFLIPRLNIEGAVETQQAITDVAPSTIQVEMQQFEEVPAQEPTTTPSDQHHGTILIKPSKPHIHYILEH